MRRTLITVLAMVGACVAFVGTLTLISVLVVRGAVGPSSPANESPTVVPAGNVHGTVPAPTVKPTTTTVSPSKKP